MNTQLATMCVKCTNIILLTCHATHVYEQLLSNCNRAYNNTQSPDIFWHKKHLSGQIKFGQQNLLYILNGNFIEFAKIMNIWTIFSHYHCAAVMVDFYFKFKCHQHHPLYSISLLRKYI